LKDILLCVLRLRLTINVHVDCQLDDVS